MPETHDIRQLIIDDFQKLSHGGNILGHLLLNVLMKREEAIKKADPQKTHKEANEEAFDCCERPAAVSLTINGIEVPIMEVMKDWDQQLERMVAETAVKLMASKFDGLEQQLDDFKESIQKLRRSILLNLKGSLETSLSVNIPLDEEDC